MPTFYVVSLPRRGSKQLMIACTLAVINLADSDHDTNKGSHFRVSSHDSNKEARANKLDTVYILQRTGRPHVV